MRFMHRFHSIAKPGDKILELARSEGSPASRLEVLHLSCHPVACGPVFLSSRVLLRRPLPTHHQNQNLMVFVPLSVWKRLSF